MASGLELHEASAVGDYDAVELLLKNGKHDPNLKDIEWGYRTPLHWAATKGFVDIARLLLEHDSNGTSVMSSGWTPAHCAAESGKLALLKALHANHAAIDKPDFFGDTPRRIAHIYAHFDCVHYLTVAEKECAEKRANGKLLHDGDLDLDYYPELKASLERKVEGNGLHK